MRLSGSAGIGRRPSSHALYSRPDTRRFRYGLRELVHCQRRHISSSARLLAARRSASSDSAFRTAGSSSPMSARCPDRRPSPRRMAKPAFASPPWIARQTLSMASTARAWRRRSTSSLRSRRAAFSRAWKAKESRRHLCRLCRETPAAFAASVTVAPATRASIARSWDGEIASCSGVALRLIQSPSPAACRPT